MTSSRGPVHPVLRVPRSAHPWVRRRRRVSVSGLTGVAGASALAAVPPPVAATRLRGIGDGENPSLVTVPLEKLPSTFLAGDAPPRAAIACEDEVLVKARAS